MFAGGISESAKACTYEKFVVRVPVEKAVATVGVELTIPPGVIVFATQPKTGWHADLQLQRGVIRQIRWSGGKLDAHEFDEFAFLAATPKKATVVNWDANQTYADGSVVRWTGMPKSDTPHSQTTIVGNPQGCKTR